MLWFFSLSQPQLLSTGMAVRGYPEKISIFKTVYTVFWLTVVYNSSNAANISSCSFTPHLEWKQVISRPDLETNRGKAGSQDIWLGRKVKPWATDPAYISVSYFGKDVPILSSFCFLRETNPSCWFPTVPSFLPHKCLLCAYTKLACTHSTDEKLYKREFLFYGSSASQGWW